MQKANDALSMCAKASTGDDESMHVRSDENVTFQRKQQPTPRPSSQSRAWSGLIILFLVSDGFPLCSEGVKFAVKKLNYVSGGAEFDKCRNKISVGQKAFDENRFEEVSLTGTRQQFSEAVSACRSTSLPGILWSVNQIRGSLRYWELFINGSKNTTKLQFINN